MMDKIENEADYDAALKRVEELFNADPNTPEGQELDVLVTLVEEYENIHYPIAPPSKEAALRFRQEQSIMDRLTPYTAHADEVPKLSGRELGETD